MKNWEIILAILANVTQAIAYLLSHNLLISFGFAVLFIISWVLIDKKVSVGGGKTSK